MVHGDFYVGFSKIPALYDSGTVSAIRTKKADQTACMEPPTKNRTLINMRKLLEEAVRNEAKICTVDNVMIIVLRPR